MNISQVLFLVLSRRLFDRRHGFLFSCLIRSVYVWIVRGASSGVVLFVVALFVVLFLGFGCFLFRFFFGFFVVFFSNVRCCFASSFAGGVVQAEQKEHTVDG